jgi:hypothetical protein
MNKETAAGAYAGNETLTSPQEFLFGPGWSEQEIYILTFGIPGHIKVTELGIVGQGVVHGRCTDYSAKHRVGTDILDPLAQAVYDPAIIQAF